MEGAMRRIHALRDQLDPRMHADSSSAQANVLETQWCRAAIASAAHESPHGPPVVIGGMLLDVQARPSDGMALLRGGSVPGTIQQRPGGVARNIGECLARLCRMPSLERAGLLPVLISAVGQDAAGDLLLSQWRHLGLSTRAVHTMPGLRTPSVSIIFDSGGEVAASIADVGLLEAQLPKLVKLHKQDIQNAPLLLLDGNMPQHTIAEAASMAASAGVPVWFEPVSVPKAARAAGSLHLLEYISPNAAELVSISEALAAGKSSLPQHGSEQPPAGQNPETAGRKRVMELWHHIKRVLSAGPRNIVLTLGADGAALCTLGAHGSSVKVAYMPAVPAQLVSTSGAGDCLVAGCCWGLLKGQDALTALAHGMAVAHAAVETHLNVPEGLTLKGLAKGASMALTACQRWDIPFHGHS